jgi:hypothetical protein
MEPLFCEFMSTFRYFFLTALLLSFVVSACVKDPEPTGGGGNNNEPETSITFKCYQMDSVFLPGVFIGITPNQADRDNGVYLFSGTSDPVGEVKFEELESITYFYGATYSSPTGPVSKQGTFSLDQGDKIERELKF